MGVDTQKLILSFTTFMQPISFEDEAQDPGLLVNEVVHQEMLWQA